MNEINKKLNYFKNYLNGFNDIAECKSKKQVALGFAKVASYLFLPLPIIFGIGHLIMQHKLTRMTEFCNRVITRQDHNTPTQQILGYRRASC